MARESSDNEPPSPTRSSHRPAVVELSGEGLLTPGQCAWLAAMVDAALARLGRAGEVRVRLVGDAEMAAAHLRYHGIGETTDVLTFDLAGDPSGPLDVDILACVDEARRQAGARSLTVEREVLLYVLHGVLHCLGHDDHDDEAYARMHEAEDRLLEAIGVGATFAVEAPTRSGDRGTA